MALSASLEQRIRSEMAALAPADFRKADTSIPIFIDFLSSFFATAEKDKAALIAAGLPADRLEYYPGLLEIGSITFGIRYGVATETPEQRLYFNTEYAKAQTDRRRMFIVVGHICDKVNDAALNKNYQYLKQGDSIADTLTDVLGCAPVITKYSTYASEIRPGGVLVDEAYCTAACDRAVALLKLKGFAVEKGIAPSSAVDQLSRIITLCMNAVSEIKKFASAAFFDNPDYYNTNYAVNARKAPVEAVIVQEQPATAVTK
jgi:hypothetical protein